MSKHVFLVFVTRIKSNFNWFDSESRELCKVWLSKLESVIRELNIYFVNCGLDGVTSFKYSFFLLFHHSFVSYKFISLLLMTAMLKFYSRESSVFSQIFIYKDQEIVFLNMRTTLFFWLAVRGSQSSFIVSLDWTANLYFHFKWSIFGTISFSDTSLRSSWNMFKFFLYKTRLLI